MEIGALGSLIAQIGVPAALVVYFVYQANAREKRMSDSAEKRSSEAQEREVRLSRALDELQTFIRDDLRALTEKAINAVDAGKQVCDRVLQELHEFCCHADTKDKRQ